MCPGCVVNPQVEKLDWGSASLYREPGQEVDTGFDFALLFDSIRDLFGR